MPAFKKETQGNSTVWTLRNTKGNELKVDERGARITAMRFRDKDFTNRFIFKDDAASAVCVDGGKDFADIVWNAEQLIEGLKLSAQVGDKSVSVIYSLSNDNEISIKFEATGANDVSVSPIFSADALPDVKFRAGQKGAAWEAFADEKTYPVTEPAEVEMELGMFGYDPGCPIDYLDAGLKNGAFVFSEGASIELIVYSTQDELRAKAVDGGFAVGTCGGANGQVVYMLKNRK